MSYIILVYVTFHESFALLAIISYTLYLPIPISLMSFSVYILVNL